MHMVEDLMKRYGVGENTVLGWIKSGELKAVNVGRSPGKKRPRWRITQAAVDAFEAARTPQPAAPRAGRRKSQQHQPEVITFFA